MLKLDGCKSYVAECLPRFFLGGGRNLNFSTFVAEDLVFFLLPKMYRTLTINLFPVFKMGFPILGIRLHTIGKSWDTSVSTANSGYGSWG